MPYGDKKSYSFFKMKGKSPAYKKSSGFKIKSKSLKEALKETATEMKAKKRNV